MNQDQTVHVIGDSISIHYGPYLEQYLSPWCGYSRKTGRVGNLDEPDGANGGDSSMVLAYLQQCLAAGRQWDVLLINCGLHDVKRANGRLQIELVQYKANLAAIFELARQLAAQLVWVRTTPVIDHLHNARMADFKRFNADVERYNAAADRLAAAAADGQIDLNGFCRSLGGAEIFADHVHFTDDIRRLQGAFIAGHLLARLGLATPTRR